MKNNILYGTENQEILDCQLKDTPERALDSEDTSFPVRVFEHYTHINIGPAETLVDEILEDVLNDLDENYGDPDGNYTEPTQKMKDAALEFAKVIVAEYTPWMCEPTGKFVDYTKEEAEKIVINQFHVLCNKLSNGEKIYARGKEDGEIVRFSDFREGVVVESPSKKNHKKRIPLQHLDSDNRHRCLGNPPRLHGKESKKNITKQ